MPLIFSPWYVFILPRLLGRRFVGVSAGYIVILYVWRKTAFFYEIKQPDFHY